MKPIYHPVLVNGPYADPVVYVDFLFEKQALMFDLGEIPDLAPRKIHRITHIFVSHTHMDHFMGLDRIVRLRLGRQHELALFGPPGFIDQVQHKLAAYTWNLVRNYSESLTITAHELHTGGVMQVASFACQQRFERQDHDPVTVENGVILEQENFQVRATHLDHRIPCLGFSLEEKAHINVWKNRLDELGLPTGPWLRELKAAIRQGEADDTLFKVWWREGKKQREKIFPLGQLRDTVLRIVPGQKIAYVVDVIFHPDNATRISELAQGADMLFIETAFLHEDQALASKTYHLTARQAGRLARQAQAKRLIPMHISTRYSGREQELEHEAEAAFTGRQ